MRLISVLIAASLGSCAPFPHRTGTHADSLTLSDVVQIRALVRGRTDIRQPICEIAMVAPDKAEVSSKADCNSSGAFSVFTVSKNNGQWVLDESTIHDRDAIILMHPVVGSDT